MVKIDEGEHEMIEINVNTVKEKTKEPDTGDSVWYDGNNGDLFQDYFAERGQDETSKPKCSSSFEASQEQDANFDDFATMNMRRTCTENTDGLGKKRKSLKKRRGSNNVGRQSVIPTPAHAVMIQKEYYVAHIKRILANATKHGSLNHFEKNRIAFLIRKNGILPSNLRQKTWILASGALRAKMNNPKYYIVYELDENYEEKITRPILDSYGDMPDPYQEQIDLDLKRTFTDDDEFRGNSEIQSTMMNILLSYAKRNSSVGYCQGMNYLAGMLARVVKDEEDAFWTLTSLFENVLPLDYYCLMTEILVDQKVFLQVFYKKKSKLAKHFKAIGFDFSLILFQWLVCLLSANLSKEIAETIWDFLLLEGTVTIFRAILAILNILESQLLHMTEFNEVYTLLDQKSKELIADPEIFIKHMNRFMSIKQKNIEKLRSKYRPQILEEQENVLINNSRSGCPTPTDSAIFKRVKLLNKFFLLNRAMRKHKNDAVVDMDESKLKLSGKIKCSMNWPLCLYDFSTRSRITNFFVFKVSKPAKVVPDYFGSEDLDSRPGDMQEMRYLLVPDANKEISIYDKPSEKRRKRMQSEPEKHDEWKEPCDRLLMSRENHSCVYKGFEKHFQKLFDEEAEILFQNWTVHASHGDELLSARAVEQFINEILSFKEIEDLQNSTTVKRNSSSSDPSLTHNQSPKPSSKHIESLKNRLKSSMSQQSQEYSHSAEESKLQETYSKFSSFAFPACETQRQIFEMAVGVAQNNTFSEDENEHDSLDSLS